MELYLDRYKGFINTFIPIKKVNFFVGDNSTGKTSVLKLLEIVTSNVFFLTGSLSDKDVPLGYFSEIINANSIGEDSFCIGVDYNSGKRNSPQYYFWYKYKNTVSEPNEFRIVVNNLTIWVKPGGKKELSVLYKEVGNNVSFKDWIEDFADFNTMSTIPKVSSLQQFYAFENIARIVSDKERQNCENIFWKSNSEFIRIAPIRAAAKRWYETYGLERSSDGSHIPLVLNTLLSHKKKSEKILKSINDFGKASGLFDCLSLERMRNKEAPLSLIANYGGLKMNLLNVGFGVSQVLPLVIELLTEEKGSFAIEQPEVHLHPKAQAAFGEFLYNAVADNSKRQIVIETHSNYLINRYIYKYAHDNKRPESQILFFRRDENGNTNAHSITIENNGSIEGDFATEYMSFFMEEDLKMLEL